MSLRRVCRSSRTVSSDCRGANAAKVDVPGQSAEEQHYRQQPGYWFCSPFYRIALWNWISKNRARVEYGRRHN